MANTARHKNDNDASLFILKTGRDDSCAYFSPALFRLTICKDGAEERVNLGFAGSRLLERLLQNPGELVERDELLDFAWTGRVVSQGSLNQQVYTLRKLLSDIDSEIIQTVPRRGYMLNAQYLVEAEEPEESEANKTAYPSMPATRSSTPSPRRRNWAFNALSGLGAFVTGRR